jgi:hypothetical protein
VPGERCLRILLIDRDEIDPTLRTYIEVDDTGTAALPHAGERDTELPHPTRTGNRCPYFGIVAERLFDRLLYYQ